jgi:hypothetical protein
MRELLRAAVQFACEVNIYATERILEALAAERPMLDDPLPAGYTLDDDDFHGFSFGYDMAPFMEQTRDDIREMAKQTRTPLQLLTEPLVDAPIAPGDRIFGACLTCAHNPCTCPSSSS